MAGHRCGYMRITDILIPVNRGFTVFGVFYLLLNRVAVYEKEFPVYFDNGL